MATNITNTQLEDNSRSRIPRVVGGRPPGPPPPGGGQPTAGGGGGNTAGRPEISLAGGPGRSLSGGTVAGNIGQQTAQQNTSGATPFMQTPGMQIASQRISGQQVADDPAISAALSDFHERVAPGIQNRATMSGLGRSDAALKALSTAQGQMLAPMYEQSFQREGQRLSNLNAASENELGRRERSAGRVADANQNMAQMLMGLSQQQYGRQQGTGQALMQGGGQFRDIEQQGNAAELNDFLRRQALGENAVGMPFGGLASAGMGSATSTTGK